MPTGIYPRTPEHGKKIGEGLKGRVWTEEQRQKLRHPHKQHKSRTDPLTKKQRTNTRNGRYRARKRGADGTHTYGEWETLKAQYNWTCPCCGKREPGIVLTEDHIIPLSLGGSNNIENIQPLCMPCNSRKHTKVIKFEPMDTDSVPEEKT